MMKSLTRWMAVCLALIIVIASGILFLSAMPTMAATADNIVISCQSLTLSGKTETNTSYVRVQIVLGSNLTHVIAQQVVSTHGHLRAGATYQAHLDFHQANIAEGTHIVFSVGEWDGKKYLSPAILMGVDCTQANQSPTPYFAFPTGLPPQDSTPSAPIPTSVTPVEPSPTAHT